MIPPSEVKAWLDGEPDEEDIRLKNGAKYIPYEVVVRYLNELCGSAWATENFQHTFFTLPNRKVIVSGSVEVVVCYDDGVYELEGKTLSGAATFVLSAESNPHPAATVKSLAIMNAVKPLGRRFGWGLNAELEVQPEEEIGFDAPPDEIQINPIEDDRWKQMISDCKSLAELGLYNGKVPPHLKPFYNKMVSQLGKEEIKATKGQV